MKEKLFKLENGSWIYLSSVESISFYNTTNRHLPLPEKPWTVRIISGIHDYIEFCCKKEAVEYNDFIAEKVNSLTRNSK